MLDARVSDAWRQAGRELGILVEAPHVVRCGDGRTVEVEAYVAQFGGPSGTLVVADVDRERCSLAAATGHYVSKVGESYRRFDRKLFIETLNDWGWFRPGDTKPVWYTGKPWS